MMLAGSTCPSKTQHVPNVHWPYIYSPLRPLHKIFSHHMIPLELKCGVRCVFMHMHSCVCVGESFCMMVVFFFHFCCQHSVRRLCFFCVSTPSAWHSSSALDKQTPASQNSGRYQTSVMSVRGRRRGEDGGERRERMED